MKLREAADWSEVVSAVAIIVSLIYVGVQVTDNTAATRTATASHASTEFIDWYEHISSDAETTRIWLRGVREPESLTDEERLRFVFLLHIILLQFQNNYYMVEEGTLDERVMGSINRTLTTIKGTPGFELYWSQRADLFSPEYKAFIENLMYGSEYEANRAYTD